MNPLEFLLLFNYLARKGTTLKKNQEGSRKEIKRSSIRLPMGTCSHYRLKNLYLLQLFK